MKRGDLRNHPALVPVAAIEADPALFGKIVGKERVKVFVRTMVSKTQQPSARTLDR